MDIFKNNKKYLKILAVIWIVTLVLSVLAYMFAIGPQNRSRKNLESKLAEQKQLCELAQKAAQEETRIRLTEQVDNLRDRLKTFIIDFEDAANLTFDISRIAQEKNVVSLNVEHKSNRVAPEEDNSKNISERHIDVSFTTGFNQFAAFLNAIERHQPVLFVNQLTLIRSNQGKSSYQIKMDVAALVKKQKEDNTTAKASRQMPEEKL